MNVFVAKIKYDSGLTTASGIFSTLKGLLKFGIRHIEHATIEVYDNVSMVGKPIKIIERGKL